MFLLLGLLMYISYITVFLSNNKLILILILGSLPLSAACHRWLIVISDHLIRYGETSTLSKSYAIKVAKWPQCNQKQGLSFNKPVDRRLNPSEAYHNSRQ